MHFTQIIEVMKKSVKMTPKVRCLDKFGKGLKKTDVRKHDKCPSVCQLLKKVVTFGQRSHVAFARNSGLAVITICT